MRTNRHSIKNLFQEVNKMLQKEVSRFIKTSLAVDPNDDINEIALTDGRSGAEVYRIKVISREKRLTGTYIAKIYGFEQSENKSEKARVDAMTDAAPDFREHIVNVEAEGIAGKKYVVIYDQANNEVRGSTAFSGLSPDSLAYFTKRVSFELLHTMNRDSTTTKDATAEKFFSLLVGRQIGENGRFSYRMEGLLSKPDAECVILNDKAYPNPLYFIKNIHKYDDHLADMFFRKGIVHGDLHGDNLISSDDTYAVIDYDSVSMDSYLLYDQAYFEFSVFYDNLKDNDLKRWNTLLDFLISPSLFDEANPCEGHTE